MNCPAPQWIHAAGLCDCAAKLAREDAEPVVDTGDDYTADHAADDPRRGQAAGLNTLIRRV